MRRVALVFLATALWSWSLDQASAQGRMGGQCAGHSASSSSSMMMNSSPGFSAFTGNGSTLNNGASFGPGTTSMMGGGFGSNLNFAAANGMAGGFNPYQSANAFAQGGNGFGSFDTGFGMGAMNGQSYAQAAMFENNVFGNVTTDSDTVTIRPTNSMANSRPRARTQATKSKAKSVARKSR